MYYPEAESFIKIIASAWGYSQCTPLFTLSIWLMVLLWGRHHSYYWHKSQCRGWRKQQSLAQTQTHRPDTQTHMHKRMHTRTQAHTHIHTHTHTHKLYNWCTIIYLFLIKHHFRKQLCTTMSNLPSPLIQINKPFTVQSRLLDAVPFIAMHYSVLVGVNQKATFCLKCSR